MNIKPYKIIWNDLSYAGYRNAKSAHIIQLKKEDARPCYFCNWTNKQQASEQQFIWKNTRTKYAPLVYYNYHAYKENERHLYIKICSLLVDLHPLGMSLDILEYENHMRNSAQHLETVIDDTIDAIPNIDTALWIFPASISNISAIIIAQRIKMKYPEAVTLLCGVATKKQGEQFIQDKLFDAIICGDVVSEVRLLEYLDSFEHYKSLEGKMWSWDDCTKLQECKAESALQKQWTLFEHIKPIENNQITKYYLNITSLEEAIGCVKSLATSQQKICFCLSIPNSSFNIELLLQELCELKKEIVLFSIETICFDGILTEKQFLHMKLLEVKFLKINSRLSTGIYGSDTHTFAQIIQQGRLAMDHSIELCLPYEEKKHHEWNALDDLSLKYRKHMLRYLSILEWDTLTDSEDMQSLPIFEKNKQDCYSLKNDKFTYQCSDDDTGKTVYSEYLSHSCIRSIELNSAETLLLQKTRNVIHSFDSIHQLLKDKYKRKFTALRIIAMLNALRKQRLLYINSDYSEIISSIALKENRRR